MKEVNNSNRLGPLFKVNEMVRLKDGDGRRHVIRRIQWDPGFGRPQDGFYQYLLENGNWIMEDSLVSLGMTVKIDDIMIGDWFHVRGGDPDQVFIVEEIIRVADYEEPDNDRVLAYFANEKVPYVNYYDIDDIEPIPIAEEFLKDHGFKEEISILQYKVWFSEDRRIEMSSNDDYHNTDNEWNIHIDTADMSTSLGCELTYVHEMQHAYKLGGYPGNIIVKKYKYE